MVSTKIKADRRQSAFNFDRGFNFEAAQQHSRDEAERRRRHEADEAARRKREREADEKQRREDFERRRREYRARQEQQERQQRDEARSRHSHPFETPYDVLGVKIGASPAEIRKAWIAKIKACHPDTGHGSLADAQKINRAYETLKRSTR